MVKVWRIYPFAQETLALLMTFTCSHHLTHLTVAKHRLAVAFQEESLMIHSIVVYNLRNRGEFRVGNGIFTPRFCTILTKVELVLMKISC